MTTILLVEDNEASRDMLSRRLARRGFEVRVAVDGEEAVALAHSARPDLILMDLNLPILDGWRAAAKLKASPDTQAIPIIALTAHAMASDEAMAREAGCDGYISKPVMPKDVRAEVERWIGPP